MKVTTPLRSEGPLAVPIVELPPPCARVTVLPETGLPLASSSVTVTKEVVAPLSIWLVGLAETMEAPTSVGPPWKVTLAVAVMTKLESVTSVAV